MKTKQEHSAGGPVYQKQASRDPLSHKASEGQSKKQEYLWLLGKHSGYHKWVLPKGMIEKGETPEETAVRETEEELAVVAKIVESAPVYVDHYTYEAKLKTPVSRPESLDGPVRRVAVYQENEDFNKDSEEVVLVEKTVTFFLMEYVSGDPKDHGWEMEDAGWFGYKEAMEMLSFDGERKALEKANAILLQNA